MPSEYGWVLVRGATNGLAMAVTVGAVCGVV